MTRPTLQQMLETKNLARGAAVVAALLLGYLIPNWFASDQTHLVPLTAIDRAIPLQVEWIWVYVSFYFFLLGAYFVSTGLKAQTISVQAALISTAIGFFIFFLFPTEIQRGLYPWLGRSNIHTKMLDWIRDIDRAVNCVPSLHVCMSWIAVETYSRVTGRIGKAIAWLWFLAIAYSTMATKQHYFVDVASGALLGITVYALVLRRSRYDYK